MDVTLASSLLANANLLLVQIRVKDAKLEAEIAKAVGNVDQNKPLATQPQAASALAQATVYVVANAAGLSAATQAAVAKVAGSLSALTDATLTQLMTTKAHNALKDGQLTVRRALDVDTHRVIAPKQQRTIPLSPRLASAFASLPKRGLWIVSRLDGGALSYAAVIEVFRTLYDAAKVARPEMPLHALCAVCVPAGGRWGRGDGHAAHVEAAIQREYRKTGGSARCGASRPSRREGVRLTGASRVGRAGPRRAPIRFRPR